MWILGNRIPGDVKPQKQVRRNYQTGGPETVQRRVRASAVQYEDYVQYLVVGFRPWDTWLRLHFSRFGCSGHSSRQDNRQCRDPGKHESSFRASETATLWRMTKS